MVNINDMAARAQAALGGSQVDPSAVMPEELPEEAPAEGQTGIGGAVDVETALQNLEGAVEGYPEDLSGEIRAHIAAIRELAVQAEGAPAEGPVGPEPAPEGPPEGPQMGNLPV